MEIHTGRYASGYVTESPGKCVLFLVATPLDSDGAVSAALGNHTMQHLPRQ